MMHRPYLAYKFIAFPHIIFLLHENRETKSKSTTLVQNDNIDQVNKCQASTLNEFREKSQNTSKMCRFLYKDGMKVN